MTILANIKSAEKRIRVTEKRRLINKSRMSTLRTSVKKLNEAIDNNELDKAQELLKVVDKQLKKAAHKNLIHDNKAAREISKLTKKLNKAM